MDARHHMSELEELIEEVFSVRSMPRLQGVAEKQ
jgi:hypothetical protein